MGTGARQWLWRGVVAGAVAVGTAPLVAPWWPSWLSEVAITLGHLVALVLTVMAALFLIARRLKAGVVCLALALANAAVVVDGTGPPPVLSGERAGTAPCEAPLHVLSLNVRFDNQQRGALVQALTQAPYDLVFLQEVARSRGWAPVLRDLTAAYPHQLWRPGTDTAILGRHPVSALHPDHALSRYLKAHTLRRVATAGVLHLNGREVVVVSAHLESPRSTPRWYWRNMQLDDLALALALAQESRPVVLGADLNGVPWTPHVRRFRDRAGLTGATVATWPMSTRPDWFPVLGVQIDYVWFTVGAFTGVQAQGPSLGSDHRAVEAWLCPAAPGQPSRS